MASLEDLSDSELQLISSGKLDGLSDHALEIVSQHGNPAISQNQPVGRIGSMLNGINQNILSNEPTSLSGNMERYAPATASGMAGAAAGAALGAPLGPLGMVAGSLMGAYAGGTAAEAVRQAAIQTKNAFMGDKFSTPNEVIDQVRGQGNAQVMNEATGQALGNAWKYIKPSVVQGGKQLLRIGPNIPEKYGQAALNNPELLSNPVSGEDVAKQYSGFEQSTGLQSPMKSRLESGQGGLGQGEAKSIVDDVYQRLLHPSEGQIAPTNQELYNASQAAAYRNTLARYGNAEEAANASITSIQKKAIDNALENAAEGVGTSYKSARQSAFNNAVSESFNSWVPLNKRGDANVLRSVLAGGEAVSGMMQGEPLQIGVPLLISPKMAGYAIRGVNALAKMGTSNLGSSAMKSLADAYIQQGKQEQKNQTPIQ